MKLHIKNVKGKVVPVLN